MLTLKVTPKEIYDSTSGRFIDIPGGVYHLEHSLLAISKWESITHKPFLTKETKTHDESLLYIECMVLDDVTDFNFINFLSPEEQQEISKYMMDENTATTINNNDSKPNREVLTSELIYYYLVAATIPFECETWHINRLFMLINIAGIKNNPGKKQDAKATLRKNKALNDARRKSMSTKG